MLNRKPGSDRGHYDVKTNSFIYSPGRLHMQTYDDRFTNESSGSRMSDFSVSSLGDTFRYDGQSLNAQETGSYSPSLHHGREGVPCPKVTEPTLYTIFYIFSNIYHFVVFVCCGFFIISIYK